jgi:Sec7-like guanine-nucleotide exchange factor
MQVSHILPDPMDSKSVASLLRFARGIDKQIIGNFMGKNADFNQEVMAEYVRTFPFGAMDFDAAFRAFADTFKQPPESQQVVRFTKNFVQAFLEAHDGDYRCALISYLSPLATNLRPLASTIRV